MVRFNADPEFTHPDCALLVDPLSRKRERGSLRFLLFHPLSAAGEERVVERGNDRVSQPERVYRIPIYPVNIAYLRKYSYFLKYFKK